MISVSFWSGPPLGGDHLRTAAAIQGRMDLLSRSLHGIFYLIGWLVVFFFKWLCYYFSPPELLWGFWWKVFSQGSMLWAMGSHLCLTICWSDTWTCPSMGYVAKCPSLCCCSCPNSLKLLPVCCNQSLQLYSYNCWSPQSFSCLENLSEMLARDQCLTGTLKLLFSGPLTNRSKVIPVSITSFIEQAKSKRKSGIGKWPT